MWLPPRLLPLGLSAAEVKVQCYVAVRAGAGYSSPTVIHARMKSRTLLIPLLSNPTHPAPAGPCRDISAPLQPDDVVQFPYAVVEIKLQAKPPQWIKDLVQSGEARAESWDQVGALRL